VAVPLVLVLCTACVAPDRTFQPYEADAVSTAQDAVSAAQTALLATQAGAKGNATANYLSVILGEAEDAASSVQGQFDSIQPPDARSDALRTRLDGMLDDITKVLEQLRIHARRGEVDRLSRIAQPLEKASKKLDRFATDHER
jgi:hypothetical protein